MSLFHINNTGYLEIIFQLSEGVISFASTMLQCEQTIKLSLNKKNYRPSGVHNTTGWSSQRTELSFYFLQNSDPGPFAKIIPL